MSEEIQANGKYIIVDPIDSEQRYSGLEMLDDKTDPIQKGIIYSVGNAIEDEALKEGMILHFYRPRAQEMFIKEKKMLFLHYNDVRMVELN